jgi:hypothetical protein
MRNDICKETGIKYILGVVCARDYIYGKGDEEKGNYSSNVCVHRDRKRWENKED